MVRQLEREAINKYSWLERANITSGYGVNLLFDFADLDELCKDIEGELDSKSLGAGFLSQGLRIDEFAEHRCSLLTYINDVLYDIDSYLEDPLYKGFNEAVDLMATIDMTDGKTDNTLGVQRNVTVNGGGRGYGFEVELPELNLEDFIGSRYEETKGNSYERSTYNQKVNDFADLFAKDYEELVENGKIDSAEKSLQDYLNELILREFAHKKDAPFWKELLEQLSDLTIVIPIYEAATGKTLITGDYLTDTEGAFKLVSATVSLVTLGQGALASKGGVAFAKLFAAEVVSEAAAGTTVIVCDKAGVPSSVTISLAMLFGTTAGMAANKALIPEDFSKWMTKEEAGRYNQYWSEVQGRQGLNDYNYYRILGDSYYKDLTVNGKYKDFDFWAFEGAGKTGIGVTGEGIPIEKVNSKVLEDIYPDSSGAYGYLPKEDTAYSKIDFTDVEKAKVNQVIRKEYLGQSEVIEDTIDKMKLQGASSEEIAKVVVDMRNIDKVTARVSMDPNEVVELEARNIKKYGNPIGPDANALFKSTNIKLLKTNPSITDKEIWDSIIESAMRKDEVINTLLGIEH